MLALFDLDNTLVDRTIAITKWAVEFSTTRRLGPVAIAWLLKTDDDGFLPRHEFAAEIKARFQLPETVAALEREYEQRYPRHMRCEPNVLSGLARLRATGWRLGVITNGLAATQHAVLRHTGLTGYLDGWCISEAEGIRKPEPAIFMRTAQRCGHPETGWMIGDNPDADILGGHRAGLHTIWIRRGRTWPAMLREPEHIADTITDAIDILSRNPFTPA